MAFEFEDSDPSLEGCDDKPIQSAAACKTTTTTKNNDSLSSSLEGQSTKETKERQATTTSEDEAVNKQHQRLRKEADAERTPSCRQSWFEMVEEEQNVRLDSHSGEELKEMEVTGSDSKMSIEEGSSNSSSRQIEIDILDSANVEKYEKLIQKDMIKSPFKRRLSGGDEEGDGDGHAKFSEGEADYDEPPGAANQHKKTKMHENDHGRVRFRRESSSSGDASSQSSRKPVEYEKDMAILERRQKQIDYGKNTLGYENYMKSVSRDQRTNDHPKTPPKHFKYSRRAWDGVVKVWRKKLHCFDPDAQLEADN